MTSKPLERTRSLSSPEVIRQTLPPFPHVEVRERFDGSWTVWYPDPGWIPCEPVCHLRERDRNHKHDYEQRWVQTNYLPASYDDALEWADLLAEGREVKVVPYMTAAERRAEGRKTNA